MKRTRKPLKAKVEKLSHKHIQVNIEKQCSMARLVASSGWLSVNRGMMKTYGALQALFMSQVIDTFLYWANHDKLQQDGSFFIRTAVIAETLGMSEHQIRRCKKEMKDAGVLFTMMKGVPPKEYYFVDIGKVLLSVYRINPKEIGGLNLKKVEEYIKDHNNKRPNKENKDNSRHTKKINPDQFEEFWKLYPRKVGKPAAKLKWETLSNKSTKDQPEFEFIKKAIQEQSESDQWQNQQYIPHPSTWLNQERWNDELPKNNKPPKAKLPTAAGLDDRMYSKGESHDF